MQAKIRFQSKSTVYHIEKGSVASTIKLKDDVIVDMDKDGSVLGVELLNPPMPRNRAELQHSIPMAVA